MSKVLTPDERFFVWIAIIIMVASGIGWVWHWRVQNTVVIPAYGGKYSEALVGEPQFINPILISTNDTDRDIAAFVYSGLTKYDYDGNIVPDLAEGYEMSEDGMNYTFYLRQDVKWHDGKTFTANDVVFTISSILDANYGSPLRFSWQGVNVEKRDDYTVVFKLSKPYFQFPEKTALGILPQHIWSVVDTKNIGLAEANLKPVGTGPYVFSKYTKNKLGNITSFYLSANEYFYGERPYIDAIDFYFFDDEDQALEALKNRDVDGLASVSARNKDEASGYRTRIYDLKMPKYFSVFFNQTKSKALADKNVRIALNKSTDKKEIGSEVFKDSVTLIDSPILPWMASYNPDTKKYEFSADEAAKILEENGWQDRDDGVREKTIGSDKGPTKLEFTLATSDFPDHIQTGQILQKQWQAIGAKVNLESYSIDELKQRIIKQRKYDALLFGEVLSQNPDPYVFWHSSQKKDPGLNLAVYDNKEADQLLETARQAKKLEEHEDAIKKFQQILAEDAPALFLYSPHYSYAVNKRVKNIGAAKISMPARRFAGVEKWYVKTKRVEK